MWDTSRCVYELFDYQCYQLNLCCTKIAFFSNLHLSTYSEQIAKYLSDLAQKCKLQKKYHQSLGITISRQPSQTPTQTPTNYFFPLFWREEVEKNSSNQREKCNIFDSVKPLLSQNFFQFFFFFFEGSSKGYC